ncbi:Arsenate reductase [Ephemeroptericola cinctiostellae]|uniref:Arsenate reductase n=1 Tax=Ephemeroptericola cinctiostellae TaxID=2268024 RepID=A0A345DBM8_9BURK|nr:Arsenate reductase [Ephemeroptericola cinctiostellae]
MKHTDSTHTSNTTTVSIYHNPKCGTSRNTLELIRQAGIEPEIVLYLETPPSRTELTQLIADMGICARDLVRTKGDLYLELNLANAALNEDEWVDIMVEHPILIERPIVVTTHGTRLCRPADRVLEILPK